MKISKMDVFTVFLLAALGMAFCGTALIATFDAPVRVMKTAWALLGGGLITLIIAIGLLADEVMRALKKIDKGQ